MSYEDSIRIEQARTARKRLVSLAELHAEKIRENIAKGYWATPAKAFVLWHMSPELEAEVRRVLARREIWPPQEWRYAV